MVSGLNADELNILGAKITFISYGLVVLAAETQALANKETDTQAKEDLSTSATNFNNTGNFMTLAGDTISSVAANLVVAGKEKNPAAKANILGNWLSVISDIILIIASKLDELESE